MNMVIHDMRNPTVAVKIGLQDAIEKLKGMDQFLTMLNSLNS